MFLKTISKYFVKKSPKFFKKVSKAPKKVLTESKIPEIPSSIEEALKFKRDYLKSFPSHYHPEFVEKTWNDFW